ncbi:MAG: VCBS repeat-containing protein, partial [Blastocatellia bacterium]|nr:VCBS repeat-containing protein [Blastocatellia bacterium]
NLGNGTFADQTAQAGIQRPGGDWPQGSWVDYDNDGWLDLFLTTYETNALYRSRGDGTFQFVDVGNLRTDGDRVSSSAWGDFDGDGFPDILLPCGDTVATRNHLYRGGTNGNHWLKVRLVGTTSNRDGIGAKVRVRATLGGRTFWQLREVSGNSAPGGAQQLLPHFGLGNST